MPVPKGEEQRPSTSPNVAPHGIDTVDDGSKGWNSTDQHREQSTSNNFAKCPKDQSTDDKGVNSTTHAQPMYHLMPNNVPNSDYRPMLNAQVATTGLENVHYLSRSAITRIPTCFLTQYLSVTLYGVYADA